MERRKIVEAELCPDHVHMLVEIPPKMAVSNFMGYLKGKSTTMIYEQFPELKYKYRNREFWCKGYYVDTVGKQGAFWDVVVDVGCTAYSVWQVLKDPKNPANWLALGADLACLAVPGVTGGGIIVRAASKADDVIDVGKVTKSSKNNTSIQPYYPPNDGFLGSPKKTVLPKGTLLQRTGSLQGAYVAPAGIPKQMLALPYDKIGEKTTILQVQKDVEVMSGTVAPWFGQIGCGTQYILSDPVLKLIDNGSIRIME